MVNFLSLIAGALLSSLAAADISIGKVSGTFTASDTVSLTWVDDGASPSMDDLSSLTILICTGSDSDIHCFNNVPFESSVSLSSLDGAYKADLSTIAAVGTNGPYFFQFYATATDITTIHYTNKFTISSGMTGSYKATDGGSTDAPAAQVQEGATQAATVNTASFTIYYTAQTGISRYAPMQTQPGTTVTASMTPIARYPSTSVSYFSTAERSAKQSTTITPGWNYTFTSNINYATPAPTPTYYYAASKHMAARISSIKQNKARRWLDS